MLLLLSYLRKKFNTSIKKSIKRQFEIDSQPFRANGLGPGGFIFLEFFLTLFFSFFFLWDFSVFYFLLSLFDFYIAYLQWKIDTIFSWEKKSKYTLLRFWYGDFFLYPLQNYVSKNWFYFNYQDLFVLIFRCFPFLGVLLFYGLGEAFMFIHYYGINEMEQVQPKTAITQFLDVTCFSYKADRLAVFFDNRKLLDYTDIQLMNHFVREIEALATVDHLFIDYRRAQDSNALESIYWHNFPGDLNTMLVRFFGGFLGCFGLYLSFDFGFFILAVVGSFFVFEFFDEFDESYRYLSTVTDYRKLFYRQIVFLPQAIAEVYGYSGLGPEFFLNSVRKEIKSFRNYYEKKVKSSERGADSAFERVGKDITNITIDYSCVYYEKLFNMELSQLLRQCQENIQNLNLENKDFLYFLFYKKYKNWSLQKQQKISDELLVYYTYLQEYSRTNDTAVVNREFNNRQFRSALIKKNKLVTAEHDLAMAKLFSIEGLVKRANLEDFANILGEDVLDQFVQNTQTEADKEFAEQVAKKKEEKQKKKEEKRARLLKSLNVSFNVERDQFFFDYLFSVWPFLYKNITLFLFNLQKKLILYFFLFCKFFYLKMTFCLTFFWNYWFKNFFFFAYLGCFIFLQWCFNLPFLIFFFFFSRFLSPKQLMSLKKIVLNWNSRLNIWYKRGFYSSKTEFKRLWWILFKKLFPRIKVTEQTNTFEILRQMYYLFRLYLLQWWHSERYVDIFDLMENDEIRYEVIVRVMSSPLDAGAAAVPGEGRAWDDPRLASLYSSRKVIDASIGITFGSVGLGFLGACFHYAMYSLSSTIPFEVFADNELWFLGEGLLVTLTSAADWAFFDTWFDSVSYMNIHAERFRLEEYCTYNMQEILFEMEDDNSTVFIDDYVFDEELLPFGRRSESAFSEEKMIDIEYFRLQTDRNKNRLGNKAQFYDLKYPLVLFDFAKVFKLNEFTEYLTTDAVVTHDYLDRVRRYRIYTDREMTIRGYFKRPLDSVDRSWQWHKRLARFWRDYQLFGRKILRNYHFWNYDWVTGNRDYWGDTEDFLKELRPYSVLEYEQLPSFYDFHVLNYPVFSRFYLDDGGDEDAMFEDGNEDSQDEMSNEQYYHKNTTRVWWESIYTIFKLDLFLWKERWYAKFWLEKFAMEYYINKLIDFSIAWFVKFKMLLLKLKNFFF